IRTVECDVHASFFALCRPVFEYQPRRIRACRLGCARHEFRVIGEALSIKRKIGRRAGFGTGADAHRTRGADVACVMRQLLADGLPRATIRLLRHTAAVSLPDLVAWIAVDDRMRSR